MPFRASQSDSSRRPKPARPGPFPFQAERRSLISMILNSRPGGNRMRAGGSRRGSAIQGADSRWPRLFAAAENATRLRGAALPPRLPPAAGCGYSPQRKTLRCTAAWHCPSATAAASRRPRLETLRYAVIQSAGTVAPRQIKGRPRIARAALVDRAEPLGDSACGLICRAEPQRGPAMARLAARAPGGPRGLAQPYFLG